MATCATGARRLTAHGQFGGPCVLRVCQSYLAVCQSKGMWKWDVERGWGYWSAGLKLWGCPHGVLRQEAKHSSGGGVVN